MPSILSFESTLVRRLIIVSYWLIAVTAACIWWNATSIERLSLPEARVHAQASRTVSRTLACARAPD
jgi:phosphatidylinositol glycan class S